MFPHRPVAALLLLTLLVALLPAAQGLGCRLCGKTGRCCCFLRPASAPAKGEHCAMHGDHAACAMNGTGQRPAALRAPQTFPDRTGTLAALAAPVPVDASGSLDLPGFRTPALLRPSPPTPPPRSIRLV